MDRKKLVEQLANDIILVMRKHKHFIDRPVVLDIEQALDARLEIELRELDSVMSVMRSADGLSRIGTVVSVSSGNYDDADALYDWLENLQQQRLDEPPEPSSAK